MNSTTLTDGLFCIGAIKTPADVKGKAVAISTFGGTSHGSALLLLKGIGLTDTKDATVTQVGNEGTRIAALKGGSVGCARRHVPGLGHEGRGLNLLLDLSKAKLQWGRSGLMARTDFIAKNPNTVLVVVASTLEAQNSIWTDTATATAKFADWAQVKPDAADIVVRDFLTHGSRSMTFTADAFVAPRDVLAAVNPAVKDVDVTKAKPPPKETPDAHDTVRTARAPISAWRLIRTSSSRAPSSPTASASIRSGCAITSSSIRTAWRAPTGPSSSRS